MSVMSVLFAWLSHALGGWSDDMTTLCYFMIIDFCLGIVLALVFKSSSKTSSGGLSSSACVKGLFRKILMIVAIFVVYRIELILGTKILKDTVIIGFIINETISIIENIGLMGLPLPKVVNEAVDLLKKKGDESIDNQ
jgi:toxin secretion/phage lysis holin